MPMEIPVAVYQNYAEKDIFLYTLDISGRMQRKLLGGYFLGDPSFTFFVCPIMHSYCVYTHYFYN